MQYRRRGVAWARAPRILAQGISQQECKADRHGWAADGEGPICRSHPTACVLRQAQGKLWAAFLRCPSTALKGRLENSTIQERR